jgi:hypothetical protein
MVITASVPGSGSIPLSMCVLFAPPNEVEEFVKELVVVGVVNGEDKLCWGIGAVSFNPRELGRIINFPGSSASALFNIGACEVGHGSSS